MQEKRMVLEKPRRIKDKKAVEQARKEWCELCGKPGNVHVHHIKTKGSGGGDLPENLISLCLYCHDKAHRAIISKAYLKEIVKRRA